MRRMNEGKIAKDLTSYERARIAVKLFQINKENASDGYGAYVKVPESADSYYEIYLEAPTQTCMMELIRSVLFKRIRTIEL